MANRYLNQFLSRGTAAQRAAYTPDPPSPVVDPVHAYLWWETDTARLYAWNGSTWVLSAPGVKVLGITVDGGGAVVTPGSKGYIQCPISGTITKWTLLANAAGNVTFGVTKDAFGSFPPTTSIVASAPPSMTGAASATQSSLGTWTTSVTAGDVFGFEITGTPTVMVRVTLQIEVTP